MNRTHEQTAVTHAAKQPFSFSQTLNVKEECAIVSVLAKPAGIRRLSALVLFFSGLPECLQH